MAAFLFSNVRCWSKRAAAAASAASARQPVVAPRTHFGNLELVLCLKGKFARGADSNRRAGPADQKCDNFALSSESMMNLQDDLMIDRESQ